VIDANVNRVLVRSQWRGCLPAVMFLPTCGFFFVCAWVFSLNSSNFEKKKNVKGD